MTALQEIVEPPEQVRLLKAESAIEFSWPDGVLTRVTCLELRLACGCSGCTQARYSGRERPVDPAVTVEEILPMGVSGLQFLFSDGHRRGHYPWRYLRELGASA